MENEPLILETKRKIISLSTLDDVNKYADEGYRLHTYTELMIDGSWSRTFIMTLETGYADVTRVADAPEEVANGLLALNDGWEIASTSVSSKFYRMIKRGNQPKLSVIRECLAQIFNVTEDDHSESSTLDQIYKLSGRALDELDNPNKSSETN